MRFSIRDLLFVTTIVALAVGWMQSSLRYAANVTKLKDKLAAATKLNASLAARGEALAASVENEAKLRLSLSAQQSLLENQLLRLGYRPATRREDRLPEFERLSPKTKRQYRQRTVEQLQREIERLKSLMSEKKESEET